MKFTGDAIAVAFATLFAVPFASAQTLDITLKDSIFTLYSTNQEEYANNQNHNTANDVELGDSKATLVGNLWKAFSLMENNVGVDVSEGTFLKFDFNLIEEAEFQAICLDENLSLGADTVATDYASGRRCFVLANSQGWITNMINVPHTVGEGESIHFEIPVGRYFTGVMNYLAFLQDNDVDRAVGLSEFSNIEIVDAEPATIDITVQGQTVEIPAHPQLDYYIKSPNDQDTKDFLMHVSEDSITVTIHGNQFKAFELPSGGINIGVGTMLEFEFTLQEVGSVDNGFHAFCLDEDRQITSDEKRCFVVATTQSTVDIMERVQEYTEEGQTVHYTIPLGMFFGETTANFLALVQDVDPAEVRTMGKCSFSNVTIYDIQRPSLVVEVYDENTLLDNTQIQYQAGTESDTRFHVLEVTADGMHVNMTGNIHRAVELSAPIEITEATELDFDFTLREKVDYHAICLEEDLDHNDRRCFKIAGSQSRNYYSLSPQANEGDTLHYNIRVGLKYTGSSFKYLVFLQDADDDRSAGSSTFSNIVISERPPLTVNINGVDEDVFNYQLSYRNGNQDTVDNLLVVSEDSSSISMSGNVWKAMEVDSLTITDTTVLQVHFSLTQETEFHAICFDKDLEQTNNANCFMLAGTQENNLGNLIYQGIQQTHEGESHSYLIRFKEFYQGEVNYIVFIQDNDSDDRTTGISTFSNIKLFEARSCLAGTGFSFDMLDCTTSTFIDRIAETMISSGCTSNDPWAELLALFDVSLDTHVTEKIGDICDSAYGLNALPFKEVTGKEEQFTSEYLDGGTTWNYGIDTDPELGDGTPLSQDARHVQVIDSTYGSSRPISWPDVHNFQGCKLRVAMCCFVTRRDPKKDAKDDNSDACYHNFKNAQQSSHVRDGYSIYGNGVEGNLNCHGFAWGNDRGFADSALKGNSLFEVAMKNRLYDNGHVEELPGAPLCGCIEQMPVVTKADCTETTANQNVAVTYDHTTASFVAEVEITNISHESCDDLSEHYGDLVEIGKATAREKALLDKHLVGEGNCAVAIGNFLEEKGFMYSS